jgi:hypothetical protein
MVVVKKYELLPTTRYTPEGKPLWQLRALREFARVKAGDLGGFVEGAHNLPQDGNAWVHPGATLYGDGYVSDGTPIIPVAVRPVKPPTRRSFRPGSGFVFR